MPAKIFDGLSFTEVYYLKLRKFLESNGLINDLTLSVIYSSDDLRSQSYINIKQKVADRIGIKIEVIDTKDFKNNYHDKLISCIKEKNNDKKVDGLIVQLPIKDNEVDLISIANTISVEKDVDGLSSANLGRLLLGDKHAFIPCTPNALLKILKSENIQTSGKNVVVIGRGILVGRIISILLSSKPYDATVTLCHTKSMYLELYTKRADIIISAAGCSRFLKKHYFFDNPYVLDVGISEGIDNEGKRILFGDVDFDNILDQVSFITPVKGGIGPVTVLMLMVNVIKAKLLSNKNYDLLCKLELLMEDKV